MTQDRWALRVGELIDGRSGGPLYDAVLTIEGDRITDVSTWDAHVPRPGTPSCDLANLTAMPGIIDAHTHMTLFADGRSYEDMARDPDGWMLMVAAQNARAHLECGVTTARDNGSRGELGLLLRDAIAAGLVEGPRMLVSGPPVTEPDGHFHFFGRLARSADEVRVAVDSLASIGVDHIKVMASGGESAGTDPRRASFGVAELRAARESAHDHGLLTTAHCRALESMERSVVAGMDCMEHAEFLRPDGSVRFDADVATRMVESGIYVSPTLPAYGWHTVARLREIEARRGLTGSEQQALAQALHDTEHVLDNFRRMLDAGLGPRMIAGTDAGCSDFTFGHIDYCMQLMEMGGMDRSDVLRACTSVAAEALGIGDEVGALAAGYRADVVLVGSSPLRSLDAMSDVRGVIRNGRVALDRDNLLGGAGSHATSRPVPQSAGR